MVPGRPSIHCDCVSNAHTDNRSGPALILEYESQRKNPYTAYHPVVSGAQCQSCKATPQRLETARVVTLPFWKDEDCALALDYIENLLESVLVTEVMRVARASLHS